MPRRKLARRKLAKTGMSAASGIGRRTNRFVADVIT
jgi:hypothetical protein